MSRHITLALLVAVAAVGASAPLAAQERSTVSSAELDAAVVAAPAGNRAAVRAFLATDEGQEVADRVGMTAAELSARVATLDEGTVALLAEQTAPGDGDLAGGANTVVISTTTVIIALLLIILLVD